MRFLRLRIAVAFVALVTIGLPADVAGAWLPPAAPGAVQEAGLAAGFAETTIWSGLASPTAVRFAADGRVFVALKSGQINVYDSLTDSTPTVFSGLTTNVDNYWDRGLLGLALDPSLTGGSGNGSYIYVGYGYDHILGDDPGNVPRWGDQCPSTSSGGPGATTDGCVISGRVSRLPVSGTTITNSEQVLVEDWCQQFPSHSVDSVVFGPDGYLYASAGDGANFNPIDYGQWGGTTDPVITPTNPCGDPGGSTPTPPTAEGGALRSQDVRTTGDPTGLDGSIIRINPNTGAGAPGNPFAASSDANAKRITSYGFRNPFRITFRPGTSELWVGDVGWNTWEEVDRITNATDGTADDFGWPCYEGSGRQGSYDAANLNLCENLYAAGTGAVVAPMFSYNHSAQVVSGEACPTGSSSISGMAFYPTSGGSFPASYQGGLFFADYSRDCIWFAPKGSNGLPDFSQVQTFLAADKNPVDLQIGPGGDLFYVDLGTGANGAVRRISPNFPSAVIHADKTSGSAPLTVNFDASGSSDPLGQALTYAWDLDGDGQYDDATGVTAQRTYSSVGDVNVGLKVTNTSLGTDTDHVTISAGNSPPEPVISTPSASLTWKVGDDIAFSGSATDDQDGTIPASGLSWTVILHHCPSNCHTHIVTTMNGVASGTFEAPDHEYPSYLELRLTATDSNGKTASVSTDLDPQTVDLTFGTVRSGLTLGVDSLVAAAPFTKTVIVGSQNSVSAPTPQTFGVGTYAFDSWSDGQAATHTIIAPSSDASYTATYDVTKLTIPARTDAQIRSAHPYTNYGSSSTLRVRSGRSRVYVKFDVTGISARPQSAKLRFWVTDGGSSGGTVYRVSSSWAESSITWHNAPTIRTSALGSYGSVSAGHWVEVDVKSVITKSGTYSFAISGGNSNSVDYASTETSHDPVLVITP